MIVLAGAIAFLVLASTWTMVALKQWQRDQELLKLEEAPRYMAELPIYGLDAVQIPRFYGVGLKDEPPSLCSCCGDDPCICHPYCLCKGPGGLPVLSSTCYTRQ